MTNLTDRLRTRNNSPTGFGLGPVCDEAANEIERLTAEANQCGNGPACLRKEAMIDSLRAESAGLREDAERYRWLRDQARSVDWTRDLGRGRREWHCRIGPQGMDAAIDAARGTP